MPHLRRGEAEHLVEVRFQAEVLADVEAAGDVVHGDRRDTGDEQALQTATGALCAALEGGEEVAVEAAAVGEGMVRLGAVIRQHGVGEVVVLVDEHVQRDALVARVPEQLGELRGDGGRREDVPQHRFGKQVGMTPQRPPELYVAVGLEFPLQGLELVIHHREVEAQDHVAAALLRPVAPDVGAREYGLEVAPPEAVVVVLQQRHPQRLAEAARADQKGVPLLLQTPQEAGLVDVQPPVQADALEVGLAVGNARVSGEHGHCRNLDTLDSIGSTARQAMCGSSRGLPGAVPSAVLAVGRPHRSASSSRNLRQAATGGPARQLPRGPWLSHCACHLLTRSTNVILTSSNVRTGGSAAPTGAGRSIICPTQSTHARCSSAARGTRNQPCNVSPPGARPPATGNAPSPPTARSRLRRGESSAAARRTSST